MSEGTRLICRILDSIRDDYILVVNQERRIVYVNTPFLEHFGYRREEIVGKLCHEMSRPFHEPCTAAQGQCPLDKTLSLGKPQTTILTRIWHGQRLSYEAMFYPLQDEGLVGPMVVGVFRDITTKRQLEQELRHRHEFESRLIRISIDGIIANDRQGNILIYNEGAQKILGYRPDEVIGKLNVAQLYPPGLAREIKKKIYSEDYGGPGKLENFETVLKGKDEILVPVWLSACLIYEDDQEVGVVGFFRDISERKRMEEKLLQNERLATVGKMAAHIGHEIKNPLMLIGGFARQVQRSASLDEKDQRKLQIIQEETERLERFLTDLGSFTRVSAPHKKPGEIIAIIHDVAEMMEPSFKEQEVEFSLQQPSEVPIFSFDSGQLRQVFLNLFKNALEAMPTGGELRVQVETVDHDLHLIVADTGQGIPPQVQKELFNPFFTTKDKGTGLGLAISRQIIEQHQGDITIESEVRRGTRCIIRLPME
ncbi:MAG: PAS domain S-box protein [Deltaproteobacteria bacterium]|nr:PAS domain S-box protein [Deltaproteobacteria bacterium]MBW1952672.1 PAS domain S-box protein [Deltaproteobacteria bacterium]MBW1987798.1 PAS domain S-box protein [Deltaproteobacteria bacterium]MBW2133906.1 PAS domain S-box protein [Deltaproteobacteria bacterium]